MNIKELVKQDLPDFRGIIVADGAAYLNELKDFKATIAWKFKKERGKVFNKVLVAGNKKEPLSNKGSYFIADIVDIVTIRELAHMSAYHKILEHHKKYLGNWIEKQMEIRDNIEPLGIDLRNAILFKNPIEGKFSTSNFSFLSNPVTYII